MITKHTCNNGRGPVFGRRTDGCPRCAELSAGAAPIQWSDRRALIERMRLAELRHPHNCAASKCGPVCTWGEY